MKLIFISLFLSLLLFSCSSDRHISKEPEEIKNVFEDDNFLKCIKSHDKNYCINKIQNNKNEKVLIGTGFYIDFDLKLAEINFNNFNGKVEEIIFSMPYEINVGNLNSEQLKIFLLKNKSESLRINFLSYVDDQSFILENINFGNLKYLYLDLGGDYSFLTKTFSVLSKKIKNNNLILSIFVNNYSLPEQDQKILMEMNISKLFFSGIAPKKHFIHGEKVDLLKYNKDMKKFDDKIKNILNKSNTLKNITVDEYKIFNKKDGKIEIIDIRINKT